jgi:hypothetical protein
MTLEEAKALPIGALLRKDSFPQSSGMWVVISKDETNITLSDDVGVYVVDEPRWQYFDLRIDQEFSVQYWQNVKRIA